MRKFYQNNRLFYPSVHRFFITLLLTAGSFFSVTAQCPPNIDFELGDFTGWQCFTGTFVPTGTVTVNPTVPTPGRFDIISAATVPAVDQWGLFPRLCPNGSGYSIKIGNEGTGTTADRVTYTFTIPATQNKFNLIYNYAIVINNSGGHPALIQPRLTVSVMNITDNTTDVCSSFDIAYSTIDPLPGFENAPSNPNVKYKPWAANSINLDGNAGKTIEISFTVTGCGAGGGTHFGYAYIDVNTECSSAFNGATFCPDDTTITVVAPFGYQNYQWWNGDHTVMYPQGNQQSITLNPPPLAGDSLTVDLTPFNGYGCASQLKAYLFDTLTVISNAGPDRATCDNNPVQLGGPPEPGRVYSWSPATGLSNPNISNPIASPSVTTQYTLTVTNSGGGCATPDIVNVDVDILSDSIEQIGPSSHCSITGETVTLKVLPHDNIQWFRNTVAIPGATQTSLTVTQSGAYYAFVSSTNGCNRTTAIKQIDIWESPVAGFTTNNANQCSAGNQFVFTNTSTLATGTLQYAWDLGDGTLTSTMDVTHSYAKEGNYTVKLLITAPGGCVDSSSFDVKVNPSPTSAFTVDVPEQCFKNNWFVFNTTSTVSTGILTYTWDFGDGNVDYSNDIAHKYAQPGTYLVKLTAKETNGGCTDDSSFTVITHQSPVTNFTINNTPQCFPGHQFILTNGTSILSDTLLYTWDMGDGVIKTDKDPVYSYAKAGNYTIKLLAGSLFGCQDSTVANVVVHPVPFADFTIRPVCVNLQVPIINRTFNNTSSTVNYLWDFGNGHTDNVKSPVYSYPTAGTYAVTLSVSTAQCPVSFDTKTIDVSIEDQLPGIVYPDVDAAFNYPEQLQARPIGSGAIWTPATNLSNRFSFTPTFKGITPQLYSIQIKTANGCLTVDTQLVKTHKKIEIYVPTGFTPNGNGINERLRPVLIGFTKVNYFRIYDRWGKMLFSMNSDQPGWDGRTGGKAVDVQTVVWMIEAVDVDGKVHQRQGTTVVIK